MLIPIFPVGTWSIALDSLSQLNSSVRSSNQLAKSVVKRKNVSSGIRESVVRILGSHEHDYVTKGLTRKFRTGRKSFVLVVRY